MGEEMQQDEGYQQFDSQNGNTEATEESQSHLCHDDEQAPEEHKPDQVKEEEGDDGMDDDDDTEDERKLFVGGLSWDTSVKELKDYFEKFGEVSSCNLKTDYETKKSRGFGFVAFNSPETVQKVLCDKEHKLHGRIIDPKKATPRPKKIFVGKLDPSISEEDVKEYFNKFGEVEKMEFPFDKSKEQRRAFCFVEFKKMSGMKKCLEDTSHKIKTQEVDVKKATPPQGAGTMMRGGPRGRGFGGPGMRGARSRGGGFQGGYGNYNQGYGYGWGQGYDQNYGYPYDHYYGGGYNYGWGNNAGYDQSYGGYGYGNQSNFGKTQKRGAGQGGYHPYR